MKVSRNGRADRSITVVFIHGQPGSSADFDEVVRRLPPSITSVLYDRPGWGSCTLDATDVRGNARYLIDSVLEKSSSGRALLVGHSYGSSVALRAAIDCPERVAGLILLAPVGEPSAISWLDSSLGFMSGTLHALLHFYKRLSKKSPGISRPIESFFAEQSRLKEDLSELTLSDVPPSLHIELIVGVDDLFNPLSGTLDLFDRLPGAKMTLLRRVGHMVPDQAPALVASKIFDVWSDCFER